MKSARASSCWLALALLAAASCPAADLQPFVQHQQLGVTLAGLRYPETLPKELTSGLINRILVRVALLADERPLGTRAVEIAVHYDLWAETFSVTLAIDGKTVDAKTHDQLADVRSSLARLRLPDLWQIADLPAGARLRLRAEALLNPIDRERMEMIRRWVKRNGTRVPVDSPEIGAPIGTTLSNAIFQRIFEQFAGGADFAATWHETVMSNPFDLQTLRQETRP
jgi:hypothetical protein